MKTTAFLAGLLLSIAAGAIAATGGGFPSRPSFQSATISTPAATDPVLSLTRATSTASAGIGRITATGRNSSAATVGYGQMQFEISSNTAGSHVGRFAIQTAQLGTLGNAWVLDGSNITSANSYTARNDFATLNVYGNTGAAVVTGLSFLYDTGISYIDAKTSSAVSPLNLRASEVQWNGVKVPRTAAGTFTSAGGLTGGFNQGIAFSSKTTGVYQFTLSNFSSGAACTASPVGTSPIFVSSNVTSSTSLEVRTFNSGGAAADAGLVIVCVGN